MIPGPNPRLEDVSPWSIPPSASGQTERTISRKSDRERSKGWSRGEQEGGQRRPGQGMCDQWGHGVVCYLSTSNLMPSGPGSVGAKNGGRNRKRGRLKGWMKRRQCDLICFQVFVYIRRWNKDYKHMDSITNLNLYCITVCRILSWIQRRMRKVFLQGTQPGDTHFECDTTL